MFFVASAGKLCVSRFDELTLKLSTIAHAQAEILDDHEHRPTNLEQRRSTASQRCCPRWGRRSHLLRRPGAFGERMATPRFFNASQMVVRSPLSAAPTWARDMPSV